MSQELNEEQCWQAVLRRDREHDGRFFFGVVTTGIFCRPSCSARRPLRKNVRFYSKAVEAEREGLRACLRCRPLEDIVDQRVAVARELCAYIRRHCDSGDPLTLEVLGERVGLSPSRTRRLFREVVGITPRQYVEVCRFEMLKQGLRDGDPVTRAIYDAGFGSASRVYERTGSRLGMTPGEYGSGGRGVSISYAFANTPVGRMLVAATDRGLCCVELGEADGELLSSLQDQFPSATIEKAAQGTSEQLEPWVAALGRYLEGEEPHLDLPLDVRATAFQQKVWANLQSIPRGETRSYGEVAADIGRPGAARAVARACASNRAAIVIPCHRVIRGNGDLGGYRWGKERKAEILRRERGRQGGAAIE